MTRKVKLTYVGEDVLVCKVAQPGELVVQDALHDKGVIILLHNDLNMPITDCKSISHTIGKVIDGCYILED